MFSTNTNKNSSKRLPVIMTIKIITTMIIETQRPVSRTA